MSGRECYKRPFDLTLVALALVPLLPLWLVLGGVIALAIRLEDRGPVVYSQPRLGRGGHVFHIFKFRTMVEDAEEHTGPVWSAWRDARTTAVGRVLRRFHLDELPQVLNVIRGEMSLVGPRPERPELAERIERTVPGFPERLQVRPGIAGLAQARDAYHMHPRRKLRYDMRYIAKMSPWLDLKLCIVCVWRVLRLTADRRNGSRGRAMRPVTRGLPRRSMTLKEVSPSDARDIGTRPDTALVGGPRPAAVRYNDWRRVRMPDAGSFTPTRPVSVIVPCFDAPEALALTLAGLEGQTYPRDLFEVVIVDDGSCPPLSVPPSTPLNVRVVRQERRGFGLARARNAGVRAAAHDILVFLDGDVIAEARLLAAHARWHHVVSDALTLGFCAYVSVSGLDAVAIRRRPGSLAELFTDRPFDPPWSERHMARTGELTSRHDDLFRAVTGHNFGIARAFFDEAGGFDESFTRYGGEDTEFGYRVRTRGGLLVPVRDAFGWHQGRWAEDRERKEQDQDLQVDKLAHLIADHGFRRLSPGQIFAVPRHVVTVEAGEAPVERLLDAAGELLADPADDLVVRIETAPGRAGDDLARLKRYFAQDSRVRVAPERPALDQFPVSPYHVTIRIGAGTGRGLVPGLCAALGDAATATAVLGDGSRVSVTRAWALHRARRAGGTAADYGDARAVSATNLALGRPLRIGAGSGRLRQRRGVGAAVARVWAEARHVRGLSTGWRFLTWLAGATRWWLRRGRGAPVIQAIAPGTAHADPVLGVEIAALGEHARAVFRASSRIRHHVDDRSVDVVLADTPVETAGIEAPVVVLSEARGLATPAFDPAVDNPIGWVRDVEYHVAALGPARLLPHGTTAPRVVTTEDRDALLHCHHVEDVAAFHDGPVERAGTLVRLAARGTPIHLADRDPALGELLGSELHGLMTAAIGHADATAREALSIRMRRAALRGHSLRARARRLCEAAHIDPPALPRVSVLLATRRPENLASALANVARQRYPCLELVLALHGPGFEPAAMERAVAGFAHPVKVLRLDREQLLGSVLNAATAAASGTLLAKMDDDDLYGDEHLWDLVLAHEYSGAALVGKFPATVYLAGLDRTVRRRRVRSETWAHSITGGAMLITRSGLERAGGWRRVRHHVDQALIDDVLRAGGDVYRTHDDGYLLVRHGDRHTWTTDDDGFLVQAEAVQPGRCPELAGIEDAPPGLGPAGWGCAR